MAVDKVKRSEEDDSGDEKYSREDVERMIEEKLGEVRKKQDEGKSEDSGDLASAMNQLAELLSQKQEGERKDLKFAGDREYVSIEDIDPEDRLETPEVFFTHQSGYLIVDDKRNGQPVKTPFGNKIKFRSMASKKRQKGREEYMLHISTYVTYSRTEAEWLKNHTYYNIKFFSRLDQATESHARESSIVAKYYAQLQTTGASQLIQQCKDQGLSVDMDIDQMRHALSQKLAEKDLEFEKERSRNILEENQKEFDEAHQ